MSAERHFRHFCGVFALELLCCVVRLHGIPAVFSWLACFSIPLYRISFFRKLARTSFRATSLSSSNIRQMLKMLLLG